MYSSALYRERYIIPIMDLLSILLLFFQSTYLLYISITHENFKAKAIYPYDNEKEVLVVTEDHSLYKVSVQETEVEEITSTSIEFLDLSSSSSSPNHTEDII